MIGFFAEHGGTIVVAAALAAIVAAIVVRLVRRRRAGSCDCGCEHCKGEDACSLSGAKEPPEGSWQDPSYKA